MQVDNQTVFDDTTDLSTLNVGNLVEVSGIIVDPLTNTILATRIEYKGPACVNGMEIEVKGTVSNKLATTFQIGTLTVNYASATVDVFNNGDYVEVKSMTCPTGNNLTATSVEQENPGAEGIDDLGEDDELELKGFISGLSGSGATRSFTLNGRTVTTSSSTQYEYGTVNDLANGVLIEAEGDLDASGVLMAREIEFEQEGEDESEIEITAIPSAKTGGGASAFNTGTLTMLGLTVHVNTATTFEGGSSSAPFNLGTIVANSHCLEIEAFLDAGSNLVATSIEQEDAGDCDEVELQGPVTEKNSPNLKILGVTVFTDVNNTDFENALDQPLTQSQFFDAIDIGTLVKASGSYSGSITASEVEIED